VDNGQVEWYDLDMPPVIDLRHHFTRPMTYTDRSSVTALEWMEKVNVAGRQVLGGCGGVTDVFE